jgi:hypothetical protein
VFFAISDKVVFPISKCGAGKWSDSPTTKKIKLPKTNYLPLLCLEFHLSLSVVSLFCVKGCTDKLSEGSLR